MSHLRKFPYAPRLEYITKNEWYAAWYIRVDGLRIIHTIWIQLSVRLLRWYLKKRTYGIKLNVLW